MKILLINPLMDKSRPPDAFPLGLSYIAGTLLKNGHQVEIMDINGMKYTSEEVEEKIGSTDYEAVGITSMLGQYNYIRWLISIIKEKNPLMPVVLGGPLASSVPELIFDTTEADVIVKGEGEVTVKELFGCIENNGDLNSVKGIFYKRSGKVFKTPNQIHIENIDEIPFPAWHLFPIEIYLDHGSFGFDDLASIKSMDIITSRGCPYHCTYCFHDVFGHRYRARSAGSIIDEMKYLENKYGVRGFVFRDDTFVLNNKRIHAFCDRLIEKNYNFLWSCNGRVNLMDEELLLKMKAAGCILIGYGIESGSQEMLDKMKRKIKVEKAKEIIDSTWKVGIIPRAFVIFGMIGETLETINETIQFCKDASVIPYISFLTPIPGTEVYKDALNMGRLKDSKMLIESWENWGDIININLTNFSTEGLIRLKAKAEKEITAYIIKNHKKLLFKRLYNHYKIYGFFSMIKRFLLWLKQLYTKRMSHLRSDTIE